MNLVGYGMMGKSKDPAVPTPASRAPTPTYIPSSTDDYNKSFNVLNAEY